MKMIRLTKVTFSKFDELSGLAEGREEEVIFLNTSCIGEVSSISLPDHEVQSHVCAIIKLTSAMWHQEIIVAESPSWVISRLPLATPRNI